MEIKPRNRGRGRGSSIGLRGEGGGDWSDVKETLEELQVVEDYKVQRHHGGCARIDEGQAQLREEMEYQPTAYSSLCYNSSNSSKAPTQFALY